MEPTFHAEQFESEDWDWWHVGRRRVLAAVLADALRRVPPRPGGLEILDVGCGTGGTTAFLARSCAPGARVTGCDAAPEALALSRRRKLGDLARAEAGALPFRSASFDVVLALDVLEHHRDDAAVASEIARVLRPGGVALATVPAFDVLWGPHDVLSHHHRRYRLPELRRVLGVAGLEPLLMSYFNSLLFPGVLAVQLVRRALRAGADPEPASDLPRAMPSFVNALLRETFAAEGRWLPGRRLPFGVSVVAVARRPAQAAAAALPVARRRGGAERASLPVGRRAGTP